MTRKTEKPELFARCTLPIIFVVDTSGAMSGQSISVLNTCLEETIQNIGENRKFCCDVIPKIGILQVHTGSSWVNPNELELAERLDYQPLDAAGLRDMGSALVELNEKLSRKAFLDFPIGKGTPIIIYVVCGQITDDWRSSLYGSLLKINGIKDLLNWDLHLVKMRISKPYLKFWANQVRLSKYMNMQPLAKHSRI